ncbi:MOSC domain-containing protein [Tricharina praecox]|uniref:MOSC domain-containing protein n=1 Tax=Tricharina praecox TaxID=43433 RepID=UPI00221F06A3|nr:MOSC domain-containing protein [Tricharina praecox]KAI5850747.1 MOSC domain-containing protein [Tricharina praecox]
MHISALYIHPIKSLLPIRVTSSVLTPLGLAHDRTFVLIRAPDHTPLHIGEVPQLCLFSVSMPPSSLSDAGDGTAVLEVTHTLTQDSLRLPLVPPLGEQTEVRMHNSACAGFAVSSNADAFFSRHLGFEARLLFLGGSSRRVLGNVAPTTTPPPTQSSGFLAGWFGTPAEKEEKEKENDPAITFADCAPLLVVTEASLAAVSERTGDKVDMRKFRPNIVLSANDDVGEREDGGEEVVHAWEEDYWAELEIGEKPAAPVTLVCTANCARCTSLNVDFATGGYVENDRQPLKKLMKDRRVDEGMKYSPVFGRYAFLRSGDADAGAEVVVRVGDRVTVVRRNEDRTVFYWPGLSTGSRAVVE